MSAMTAVAAGRPDVAGRALDGLTLDDVNPRVDLEVRLLRASIALLVGSADAESLVKGALDAAERRGFLQTVLDSAPQVVRHVVSQSDRYPRTKYLEALITGALAARRNGSRARAGQLPDPLTEAELRVLERLPLRLSYSEMATDLHLSLNTVKTHLQHTYMKLGVSSRSDAVKRASALGLV
jgi:LuxR family maltose regulon positive regulatory protein